LFGNIGGSGWTSFNLGLQGNQWQMITVTASAGLATLYLNGINSGYFNYPSINGPLGFSPYYIGGKDADYNPGTGFLGDIQKVSIWNTALSSSQVSQLYTLQSAPEPSTYALFGIGAIGMLMVMRRKKRAA
jgi:hypothetical protein